MYIKVIYKSQKGDEMNLTLVLDERIGKRMLNLSPHYAIHSIMRPGEITAPFVLPEVTSSTLANWLNDD